MKQKLKMLVKIADLQMSLWEMRSLGAEPSYQATCVVKRNKWHEVKCRALSLIATLKPMADTKPAVTTGHALVNKYGTIVGIFADNEALYANIPYGRDFYAKMDR